MRTNFDGNSGTLERVAPNFIYGPKGFDYAPFLEKAQKLASKYQVILVFENGGIGSGTLVKVGDIYGILTAHHVSNVPYKNDHKGFSLCICDTPHRVDVLKSQIQHIVVGDYTTRKGEREYLGPDLSFLMLLDSRLAGSLQAKNSFYPLTNPIHQYPEKDYPNLLWVVSGCPEEFKTTLVSSRGEPLTKYSFFNAHVRFLSKKTRKGFDYLRFGGTSGKYNFPEDYGGMSGGGIWLVPLTYEAGQGLASADCSYSILQGVVYYATSKKGEERVIIGHGPHSIYNRVVETLK